MQKQLANKMKARFPKFNKRLTDGFIHRELQSVEREVVDMFRTAVSSISANEDLKYIRHQICGPEEMYRIITQKTKAYETARSDLFLVKFFFEFRGEPLPELYLFLPYCDEDGLMYLRGSLNQITPVLIDSGLSVTRKNGIFCQLSGVKFTINHENFYFRQVSLDQFGQPSYHPMNMNIPATELYKPTSARKEMSSLVTKATLGSYIFGVMGVEKAFDHYTKCEVTFGEVDAILSQYTKDDRWSVYTVSGMMNKKCRIPKGQWTSPDIAIAVRSKDPERTTPPQLAVQLAGAFLFAADTQPENFDVETIASPYAWRVIVGRCYLKRSIPRNKVLNDMEPHFYSVMRYMDERSKRRLKRENIPCDNLLDLFAHLMIHMSTIVAETNKASIYHKEINILRYILSSISESIFYFSFNLQNNSTLTINKVLEQFKNIGIDSFHKVKKDFAGLNPITYAGDNALTKISGNVLLQTAAARRQTAGHDNIFTDPTKIADASIVEAGSFLFLPKPDPTGRSRLNFMLRLNEDNQIVPKPHLVPFMDYVQTNLRTRKSTRK